MSLRDAISIPGYTSFTGTGGTATTYTNEGVGKNGRNQLTNVTEGVVSQRKVIITNLVRAVPAVNAKSNPTFGHAVTRMGLPFTDAAGKTTLIYSSYDLGSHPEMTEAQRLTHAMALVNLILAPDMQGLNVRSVHA